MLKLSNGYLSYGSGEPAGIQFPDLALLPGQSIGLFGPSGLGKSSLAKVLAGIEPLTGGELVLPAKQSGVANPVQWIFQQPEFAFNPRLTLRESLEESWRGQGYQPLLAQFAIEPSWLDRRPSQVSGGQLQRINILRALIESTQYLICDEITAHLDMLTQQQIWQSLGQYAKERNLALLIISHDEDLLSQVCDNIIYWE
ncbi:ATP-binding cassette domain-containing protein [Shewanella eurypsychrophilus]|uniref:ATP-binding cassette domain-containing protein n=1 Tax=Shewanella eurypsychrophilus TaxID=2593656 RepID=A0ABX6V4H1_9GAMM|nr:MULTISPECIES: ATP-binding cassette domain-containing protein [Shewanella]QFU22250.1 ATP-binding cassette domain-containing protein [Shewanella sp. YLB-09]QPG57536.1 ATP-binding cassette domain-containing protein [Shewanella eurypsychrophilus]